MKKFQDKVVLITGAASGMGREEALLFAAEGAKVIMTDLNLAALEKGAQEITVKGGAAIFMKHDVSKENDWQAVVQKALENYGRIDILVNNAALFFQKTLEETTVDEWDFIFNVNAKSVFLGCKHVVPIMRQAGGGSIVNVSSMYSVMGGDQLAVFGSSKGAVRLFSKSAAVELAKDHIRVNTVHPGYIETPMTKDLDAAQKTSLISKTLLGRAGKAQEVAHAVLFLASEEASYITGSEMTVDGGATAC